MSDFASLRFFFAGGSFSQDAEGNLINVRLWVPNALGLLLGFLLLWHGAQSGRAHKKKLEAGSVKLYQCPSSLQPCRDFTLFNAFLPCEL
jgi:hypothetical protein